MLDSPILIKSPNDLAHEWFDDLKLIPQELKIEWIKQSLESKAMLHVFGRYFFPDIIRGGDTPDCHIDLLRELTSPQSCAIIFPRGFAKSTWEKIDTIHDIVYALEPVIVYISDTLQAAGHHFESIRSQLESNETLRAVYGNLVPDVKRKKSAKWTNTHFETTNGVNVVARGAGKGRGANIKNKRPTKIVVDDAESDEQVASVMRRQKYHDWLYLVMIPSMDNERGRIKLIGNIIHKECEVLKFYEANGGILRRAIENGHSIWPEYWSDQKLADLREMMGSRAFNQELMNDPTSHDNAKVPAAWLEENFYYVMPTHQSLQLQIVISLDPQSGQKATADEFALTTVGYFIGDKHRYVLEQIAGRNISQSAQARECINAWIRWSKKPNVNVRVVGIENLMTQVGVLQNIIDWRNGAMEIDGILPTETRSIPVRGITPGGKDKVARLEKHEPMIERGELHLHGSMKKLQEQIMFLGTGALDHDDRVDSLIMALDLSYNQNDDKKITSNLATKQPSITSNLLNQKF